MQNFKHPYTYSVRQASSGASDCYQMQVLLQDSRYLEPMLQCILVVARNNKKPFVAVCLLLMCVSCRYDCASLNGSCQDSQHKIATPGRESYLLALSLRPRIGHLPGRDYQSQLLPWTLRHDHFQGAKAAQPSEAAAACVYAELLFHETWPYNNNSSICFKHSRNCQNFVVMCPSCHVMCLSMHASA